MLYCPKCKAKILVKVNVPGLMSYTTIINTSGLKMFANLIVEDNFKDQIKISEFYCPSCEKEFSHDEFFDFIVSSQYTGKSYKLSECCIVSILCSEEEREGNKVNLIVPPKVIAKSEINAYSKDYNPYNDPKYLLITELDQVEISF